MITPSEPMKHCSARCEGKTHNDWRSWSAPSWFRLSRGEISDCGRNTVNRSKLVPNQHKVTNEAAGCRPRDIEFFGATRITNANRDPQGRCYAYGSRRSLSETVRRRGDVDFCLHCHLGLDVFPKRAHTAFEPIVLWPRLFLALQ
jgi:hypothetical protein